MMVMDRLAGLEKSSRFETGAILFYRAKVTYRTFISGTTVTGPLPLRLLASM